MPTQKRQTFSSEFKREAVRLLEQGDKEAAQLARVTYVKDIIGFVMPTV